jgi:hypothetical protein
LLVMGKLFSTMPSFNPRMLLVALAVVAAAPILLEQCMAAPVENPCIALGEKF